MQGGQGMEEAGVRARPRSTRAEFHKERSLLDPSRPDLRQLCHQIKSFLPKRARPLSTARPARPRDNPGPPEVGRPPRHPPAVQGSGPSTSPRPSASPPPSLHVLRLRGPPRATPLSYPHAGPSNRPTWRRLPLTLGHLLGQEPERMLAVPSHRSPRTSPRLHQASSREMSAGRLRPEAEKYSHSCEGGSHAGARHSGSMPTNCRLATAAPTEAAAILVRGAGEHAH